MACLLLFFQMRMDNMSICLNQKDAVLPLVHYGIQIAFSQF